MNNNVEHRNKTMLNSNDSQLVKSHTIHETKIKLVVLMLKYYYKYIIHKSYCNSILIFRSLS